MLASLAAPVALAVTMTMPVVGAGSIKAHQGKLACLESGEVLVDRRVLRGKHLDARGCKPVQGPRANTAHEEM